MILSSCFRTNRIENDYKYSDEYLNFILKLIIYKNKSLSDHDLISCLSDYYDINVLKISSLRRRFNLLFGEKIKGKYFVNDVILNGINKFGIVKNKVDDIFGLETFLLTSSFNLEIDSYEQFVNQFVIYAVLHAKISEISKFDTEVFVFNYTDSYISKKSSVEEAITNVKKLYSTLSIYDLFKFDDIQKNILIKKNVNTVSDFCKLNINSILCLISINFDEFLTFFKSLSISLNEIVDDSLKNIDEKNLDILFKRSGYINNKKITLEEIGSELNVTKERIRQLEAKSLAQIPYAARRIKKFLYSFYNAELGKKKPYVTLNKLLSKYEKVFIYKVLLLFEHGNIDIVYDNKYQIIYDRITNNIDEMINDFIDKIGVVAEPAEIETCDLFQTNVIKNNYKKISNNLYIKNGCAYRDLYLDLIEELFPKGYRVGNDNDYNLFVDNVKKRYSLDETIPQRHSLEAMIGRSNFVLADRGLYVSNKYAVSLDQELVDSILDYISKNEFTYYNAIFDEFNSELKSLGIKNRYFLKGCLDKYLPSDMTTKRDYIVCGDTDVTPYEAIINKLHSFPGKFSKNEFTKCFPGVRDYTIYSYLYSEINNGLIWISKNEFIYVDKYDIDVDTKKELKDYIDSLFKNIDTKILTSKKIYAKMQFTNRELYEKLKLSNGHFELFSLIKALYNEYYYSRPYIYLDENDYNTRSTIVQKYVRQFDSFNYKMILDYQSNMNLGVLYSYLLFMESMSDEYVQVDIDEMVKIEKMNLDDSKINEIKKAIDLILNNFDVIDTSKFNGYTLLPRIGYVWNKYLLVGIIRSYLSEHYDIKNTDNRYDKTDFEIRRV